MNKIYHIDIETAKKKYTQIRELYDVLSNCSDLEINGSPLLERCEPTLTKYQRAENIVEKHLNRDRRHPLPTVLINNFNDKTGSDLGEVQIVYGPSANEYARSRHALALAVLDTIYFRNGAYKPETEKGRKTIAHELTHVAQHKSRPLADNRTKDELEAEAEAAEKTEQPPTEPFVVIQAGRRQYRMRRSDAVRLDAYTEREVRDWIEQEKDMMPDREYARLLKAYRLYLDGREQGRRPWTEEQ